MEDKRPYWKVGLSLLFSISITAACVVLLVKGLGFFMPFVVGWCIAAIATPLVNWLEKRLKIVKKLGSAIIVILVIGAIVAVLYAAVSRLVTEAADLVKNLPALLDRAEKLLQGMNDASPGILDKLPDGVQKILLNLADNMDQYGGKLTSRIGKPAMEAAGSIAAQIPAYLIYMIVAILSAYFFTAQWDDVNTWVRKVAPKAVEQRMGMVLHNLKTAVGGYFKAQFQIMGIIFLILLGGFILLGVRYSALIALLIAFLDFLPFFGTGTALCPWAVYCLFTGHYKMAIALLALYLITLAGHQLLQPKLVADSVGMNPLVVLILLYIGFRISSILGMILAVPVGMVVINMYRAGAFDYIFDDAAILWEGIMKLRK